ncbi:MAG: hypothetical protein F4Z01_06945 [Gammaproteobacteria bacterium]|nr:hypothetical protein [Gammaproteobacteria bacterium]
MILKVGYIFSEEVPHDIWQVAAEHEVDGSRLIHVDSALSVLEDKQAEESLTEPEQKLLNICQAAEAEGLGDIVINPP